MASFFGRIANHVPATNWRRTHETFRCFQGREAQVRIALDSWKTAVQSFLSISNQNFALATGSQEIPTRKLVKDLTLNEIQIVKMAEKPNDTQDEKIGQPASLPGVTSPKLPGVPRGKGETGNEIEALVERLDPSKTANGQHAVGTPWVSMPEVTAAPDPNKADPTPPVSLPPLPPEAPTDRGIDLILIEKQKRRSTPKPRVINTPPAPASSNEIKGLDDLDLIFEELDSETESAPGRKPINLSDLSRQTTEGQKKTLISDREKPRTGRETISQEKPSSVSEQPPTPPVTPSPASATSPAPTPVPTPPSAPETPPPPANKPAKPPTKKVKDRVEKQSSKIRTALKFAGGGIIGGGIAGSVLSYFDAGSMTPELTEHLWSDNYLDIVGENILITIAASLILSLIIYSSREAIGWLRNKKK